MNLDVAWEIKKAHRNLVLALLMLLMAADGAGVSAAAGHGSRNIAKPSSVKLFGTIEFRSDFRALPQWKRVLSKVEQQMTHFSTCKKGKCSPAAKSWQRGIRLSRDKSPMETLKTVNTFFNQWPYRLDIEIYGKPDYWATPKEFLKLSGDCEDYSIAKYFALRQLGFDPRQMRIVVIKDRIRNIGHAVLAVYMDDTAFILDNLSNIDGIYQYVNPAFAEAVGRNEDEIIGLDDAALFGFDTAKRLGTSDRWVWKTGNP